MGLMVYLLDGHGENMIFNTDLFYTDSTGFFGWSPAASWQLWFSEDYREDMGVFVMDYKFPVKPTKRQVRKLRREFRKVCKGFISYEN